MPLTAASFKMNSALFRSMTSQRVGKTRHKKCDVREVFEYEAPFRYYHCYNFIKHFLHTDRYHNRYGKNDFQGFHLVLVEKGRHQ